MQQRHIKPGRKRREIKHKGSRKTKISQHTEVFLGTHYCDEAAVEVTHTQTCEVLLQHFSICWGFS